VLLHPVIEFADLLLHCTAGFVAPAADRLGDAVQPGQQAVLDVRKWRLGSSEARGDVADQPAQSGCDQGD
jgi:hypothetical protein